MGKLIITKDNCKEIETYQIYFLKYSFWDFPGGAVVKNPPAHAGDTGSIPGLGKSRMPQSN